MNILRTIFRHYRARARLAARRARGEAILANMREAWTNAKTWENNLQWVKDQPNLGREKGGYAGLILIIGEENGLGERRLRVAKNDFRCVSGGDPKARLEESELWGRAVKWREGIEEDEV